MASYDEGDYIVDVLAQRFVDSKSSDAVGLQFDIKPLGRIDPQTGDEENLIACPNWDRRATMWFTDKTVEKNIAKLRKLGFDRANFVDLDPNRQGHYSFVNARLRMTCKHEPGTGDNAGKTFDKWEFPYEGGGLKPVEASAKAPTKLDNLFGKMLKQTATAKPAAKSAPTKQTVPQDFDGEPGGEDIPF